MAAKLKCNLIRTPFLRFVTLFSSLPLFPPVPLFFFFFFFSFSRLCHVYTYSVAERKPFTFTYTAYHLLYRFPVSRTVFRLFFTSAFHNEYILPVPLPQNYLVVSAAKNYDFWFLYSSRDTETMQLLPKLIIRKLIILATIIVNPCQSLRTNAKFCYFKHT